MDDYSSLNNALNESLKAYEELGFRFGNFIPLRRPSIGLMLRREIHASTSVPVVFNGYETRMSTMALTPGQGTGSRRKRDDPFLIVPEDLEEHLYIIPQYLHSSEEISTQLLLPLFSADKKDIHLQQITLEHLTAYNGEIQRVGFVISKKPSIYTVGIDPSCYLNSSERTQVFGTIDFTVEQDIPEDQEIIPIIS